MVKKGWHLNVISNPLGFSFVITTSNVEFVQNNTFINDLEEAYEKVIEKNF